MHPRKRRVNLAQRGCLSYAKYNLKILACGWNKWYVHPKWTMFDFNPPYLHHTISIRVY